MVPEFAIPVAEPPNELPAIVIAPVPERTFVPFAVKTVFNIETVVEEDVVRHIPALATKEELSINPVAEFEMAKAFAEVLVTLNSQNLEAKFPVELTAIGIENMEYSHVKLLAVKVDAVVVVPKLNMMHLKKKSPLEELNNPIPVVLTFPAQSYKPTPELPEEFPMIPVLFRQSSQQLYKRTFVLLAPVTVRRAAPLVTS